MQASQREYVQRFGLFPRFLHFLVIISFLTLAVTGMALKFAAQDWAEVIAEVFGSFRVLGVLHRICAVITFPERLKTLFIRLWCNLEFCRIGWE